MAGPTVEELLRAGGQRRKPPAEPQVGAAETTVNRSLGWIPGANRLTDAISAMALEAGSSGGVRATLTPEARAELQRMGEDVPEDPGLVDRYREVRDRRAERTVAGAKQHPWAARFGDVLGLGLSVLAPLPKAPGAGLGAAVKTGAGYGAFQGLTEGGADLTRGEFGEAALDTLKGAAFGGALGAGLHGAMRLGQKGVQALRGARQEVLAQETAAAQEAARKGQDELAAEVGKHRELVGKARGQMAKDFAEREAAAAAEAAALERQHGQALEVNKARAARQGREAERAAMRERDIVGQARELNKRYDAKQAEALERQIADLERAVEAERRMVGQAREMNKARDAKDRNMVGSARELDKAREAKDRNMVGSAREMNKRMDRARNLIARARYKAGDGPAPEPSTKVLEGMSGKAFERQQNRSDKALGYRRSMGDPDVDTQLASARQDFIDRMPEALNNPAALRRQYMERFLREKYGDDVADRLMRERIGPGGEVLPRPATPPTPASPAPAAAADDVSASAQRQLSPGQEQLPLLPPLETQPSRLPSGIAPPPAIREGAPGMPYGRNLRPEPLPPEPTTHLATQSMAAPRDMAVPPVSSTRTAAAPAAPPPAEVPTVPGRPALPAGAPAPAPAGPPVADDIQDVTRLAGPEDVAPLAAERAAQRERGGIGRAFHAGYSGAKEGGVAGATLGAVLGSPGKGAVIGSVLGGVGGFTKEMLRDPAVKARVLAAARLHVLARINPALYARVGAQLQGGTNQRAAEHLLARKDPEYREARAKAAEQVAGMTDQQLVDLFAQANSPI
jgi:hypothetical protein